MRTVAKSQRKSVSSRSLSVPSLPHSFDAAIKNQRICCNCQCRSGVEIVHQTRFAIGAFSSCVPKTAGAISNMRGSAGLRMLVTVGHRRSVAALGHGHGTQRLRHCCAVVVIGANKSA